MERIFKIKTKSDRDPQAQYPSERRYSASIVIGLSVVFLQLFLYSVLMGTLIVHKMADNNQKNITTDDHMELAVLEEKLQRDLEHHDEVSINIPALVCSGCFLMALGYFLSFSTGLLAWKRWYVDHNITFFFLASTFSTLTSALSLLLALLTCLNLDLDYDSYSNTPSPFPPLTISLDMNIIVLSSVGVIWSVLAARVGYRGMRNSYPDDMGVGNGVQVSTVRKGSGGCVVFPPDVISHFPAGDKLAKFLPKKEKGDGLPKAESNLEYRQRVDQFLAGRDGKNVDCV